MIRVLAFIFLVVALGMAYLQVNDRPAWADFISPIEQPINSDGQLIAIDPLGAGSKKGIAKQIPVSLQGQLDWLPDTGRPSVHAASLIPLKDGNWRAFWFAGSREGAADVVIQSAVWDASVKQWGQGTVVLDREGAQQGLSRYIKKLGNPVPIRNINGQLQLYFVAVSINDGSMGFPVYHEWIGKYGELLRLDPSGQVLDKRRMSSGRGTLQPIIFIDDEKHASAYFRQARRSGAKQIAVSHTADAGHLWTVTSDLTISNPNAAITGIELADRTRLMVFNDLEHGRHRLVLAASWLRTNNDTSSQAAKDNYSPWKIIQVLEDESASQSNPKEEFSR